MFMDFDDGVFASNVTTGRTSQAAHNEARALTEFKKQFPTRRIVDTLIRDRPHAVHLTIITEQVLRSWS